MITSTKIVRVIIICLLVIALYFLIKWATNPDNSPAWTGFGKYDENKDGPRAKTLWDWLDLLIIPFVLSILAWSYKESEKENIKRSEEERSQNEQLDSFINIMTELITNHDLGKDEASSETSTIARTRINLAFSNLNGERKGQVLQFLFEANLINKKPKISLIGGNIKNSILNGIVLSNAEIRGAYFTNVLIKDANLNGAIFIGCNFENADLSNSWVEGVDFSYANLENAKLKNMDLTSVNFSKAILTNANLEGSTILQSQLLTLQDKTGIKLNKSIIK